MTLSDSAAPTASEWQRGWPVVAAAMIEAAEADGVTEFGRIVTIGRPLVTVTSGPNGSMDSRR